MAVVPESVMAIVADPKMHSMPQVNVADAVVAVVDVSAKANVAAVVTIAVVTVAVVAIAVMTDATVASVVTVTVAPDMAGETTMATMATVSTAMTAMLRERKRPRTQENGQPNKALRNESAIHDRTLSLAPHP